ncbi:MAG: hypothetical protein GY765_08520 [bacterium]|nr:hypothetical protein [bacterium]
MKRIVFVGLCIGFVFCLLFSSKLYGVHNISVVLERVERTPDHDLETKLIDGKIFESVPLAILWAPVPMGFRFRLFNRKDDPVSILWNEVRFYDEKNRSHVVTHHGAAPRRPDQLKGMKPSVIEPRGKLQDVLFPFDSPYIRHEKELVRSGSHANNTYSKRGLRTTPIFRETIPEKEAKKILKRARKKARNPELDFADYINSRTFRIEMPLMLGETKYFYRFYFRSHLAGS